MDIAGKTIVITGAAQGIGLAIARLMSEAQADLALIDMNAASLDAARTACQGERNRVRAYAANIAIEDEVTRAFAAVVRDFGRLDGLVNNAGITRDALLIKTKDGVVTDRMTLEQWQTVIDVNLTGVFLCGREAAEHMIKLGHGGVIVNISSVSRHGNPGQTNYSAAKAGVAALSTVWGRELARYGIRVGAVAPGFTRTAMAEQMKPAALERVLSQVPIGRMGEPEEIARSVKYIFDNDFFNARCLDVDGGIFI